MYFNRKHRAAQDRPDTFLHYCLLPCRFPAPCRQGNGYPPFFNSIFRQTNTSFTQNRQYPTPFYLSALYYHGNPGLLRESILLPDSTILSPIAILSAASKNTKKRGPPPTVMNPTKPQNPLILSHSSILLPASTQIPMALFLNCCLCRVYQR